MISLAARSGQAQHLLDVADRERDLDYVAFTVKAAAEKAALKRADSVPLALVEDCPLRK